MAEAGRGFRGVDGARDREDDERHDLDPSDWYIVKDGKLMKASVYPNQHDQARAANKGMEEGVLSDIGDEIAHGAKGLKRTIQGKPSRQDIKDKYRDRSDAAYKSGDRQDAKKNADRWERVHNNTNSGMMEEDSAVKYGVFAKGGSVGSQRFRDDPLKTFDTKEEATADARRRRSGLSKGERGYYRMGYVVKPIKGVTEGDVDDFVAGGGKITQVKPNPGPRRSGVSLGSKHIGTVRGGKASSISGKRANTRPTIKPVVAVEQQVDEKSEAVRHGNNSRSIYHVDESVDPIEQLRADIRRFAQ
jgi:hypothetical protein